MKKRLSTFPFRVHSSSSYTHAEGLSPSSTPSLMATITAPIAPPGLTPATEEGVDMLRTFQLRKENAVLLAKIEASAKAIEACTAENTRFNENVGKRVAALESRISELDDKEKKHRQAIEDWGTALSTLKKNIDAMIEKEGSGGKLILPLLC
jgi:hypothetical protein